MSGEEDMEADDYFEPQDPNVWHGLFWTVEVHPYSEENYIVQKSKAVQGTTITQSRSRWITSNVVSIVFGVFVTVLLMVGGFVVGIAGGGPLLILLAFFMVIGLAYNIAILRWSMRR